MLKVLKFVGIVVGVLVVLGIVVDMIDRPQRQKAEQELFKPIADMQATEAQAAPFLGVWHVKGETTQSDVTVVGLKKWAFDLVCAGRTHVPDDWSPSNKYRRFYACAGTDDGGNNHFDMYLMVKMADGKAYVSFITESEGAGLTLADGTGSAMQLQGKLYYETDLSVHQEGTWEATR